MALNIRHPEADRLARELARRRGESITEAVLAAIREQLEREKAKACTPGIAKALLEIGRRFSALPLQDERSEGEILGYGGHGLRR